MNADNSMNELAVYAQWQDRNNLFFFTYDGSDILVWREHFRYNEQGWLVEWTKYDSLDNIIARHFHNYKMRDDKIKNRRK